MPIHVRTLGRLRVERDSQELNDLPRQGTRCALFLYLSVQREVSRDRALDFLWGNHDPSLARGALNQNIYVLRKDLGPRWVETRGDSLRVSHEVLVDVSEFQAAVEAKDYARAVQIYQGEFLRGKEFLVDAREYEAWVTGMRAKLAPQHRQAARGLIAELSTTGDTEGALHVARRWTEVEPTEDEGHDYLLRLLHAAGRSRECLDRYDVYVDELAQQDLEPLPETMRFMEEVRAAAGSAYPLAELLPTADRRGRRYEAAVLPFRTITDDAGANAYGDGVTAELITALCAAGLRVAPDSASEAFRAAGQDTAALLHVLRTDWLVDGEVHRFGQRVKITARIHGAEGADLAWSWRSEARPAAEFFDLLEELSRAVASRLLGELYVPEGQTLTYFRTAEQEAWDHYTEGRRSYDGRTPDGFARAVECFQAALSVDPHFAGAQAGLADVFIAQAQFGFSRPDEVIPKAEAAVDAALELDPSLGEAHVSRAHVLEVYHWDWEQAEAEYLTGIRLSNRSGTPPRTFNAHTWYADLLTALGRRFEARREIELAEREHPTSPPVQFGKGAILYRTGEYEAALEAFDRALAWNPRYLIAAVFRALALTEAGRAREALESLRPYREASPAVTFLELAALRAHVALGQMEEARAALMRVEAIGGQHWVPGVVTAILHGQLGDIDTAFAHLDKAAEERWGQLIFLRVEPLYRPLWGDPRCDRLLDRMGLPPL